MPGTEIGGRKAALTNKARYGDGTTKENFYVTIGRKGGKLAYKSGGLRGFAVNHEQAVAAGRKGGAASRRSK